VLADRSHTPARICLIDWEMAGIGCGLLDLVHLKYGLDHQRGQELIDAYRRGLQTSKLLPQDEQELARVLAACELHKTFYRLAHSRNWNLPPATLSLWVGEAEGFGRQVRRGGDA